MRASPVCSLLAHLLPLAAAVDPLVQLDYASYRGVNLGNSVSQWLGIRYAAPPTGNLRFAAPQDPNHESSVQDASEFGPICLATKGGAPDDSTDEDCLFANVFAPSAATSASALPVWVFIQGGGFNGNSNPNYNGSGLVTASGGNIIVVNFNYRVGPYGFLAGKEVVKGGASLNNGLKDQRKLLQWVQKYISKFGGDPNHVTMGGDSAGASSVTLHLTAYGGRDDGLFHATTSESQAFQAIFTVDQSQFAYDALVTRAKCDGKADTLACLRGLSATQLQAINTNVAFPGGAGGAPLYMYGPTLDGDLVSDYTARAYAQGKFIRVPGIYGDVLNEGTVFVPQSTNSQAETDAFLKNQFPDLTTAQLSQLATFYPVDKTPSFPNSGRNWRQVADVYGEMRYICPGLFITNTYATKLVPSWNYQWAVLNGPDTGFGVTHTVELNAIFGVDYVSGGNIPATYAAGAKNGQVANYLQAYWISFIRSYNPNTHRAPGAPVWRGSIAANPFTKGIAPERIVFRAASQPVMAGVGSAQQKRCKYLNSIALSLKQ